MIARDIPAASSAATATRISPSAALPLSGLDRLPGPLLAAITTAIYLAIGLLSLKLLVKPESIAPLWPVNAVVVCLMARVNRRRWHWLLIGQALACLVVNLFVSISIASTCCYIVGNVLESLLAVVILTRFGTEHVDFSSLRQFVRLLVAAVPGSALTATIVAAANFYLAKNSDFPGVWRLWAAADGLGMLVVVPTLLSFRLPTRGQVRTFYIVEVFCLVSVFALVSYGLFGRHMSAGAYIINRPLLITFPILIWVGLRTNVFTMCVIASIYSGFAVGGTVLGYGPFVLGEPTIQRAIGISQLSAMAWTIGGLFISIIIEENRRTLKEVSRQRERFRQLTESIGEVFWMANIGLDNTIYVSPAYEKVWGRSCESLMANPRSFIDAIHPEDRERVIRDLPIRGTGRPFAHEYRVVQPDGSIRWVFDRGFPVLDAQGHVKHFAGVAQDITQQKNFQQALVEANEFNNQIISNVQDGIIVIDLEMRYRVWNPAMERMSGLPAANVIGKTPMELFPFLRDVGVMAMLERAMAGETVSSPDFPYEVPLSGRKGWSWQLMGPLRSADGQIIGVITTVRDITQRKMFQQALLDANEFNNQIISNVQDGIIVMDLQMRYRVWSPAMERMRGIPAAQALGKTPLELFPFLREAGVIAMLERAMAGETVSSPDFPYEVPQTGCKGWNWGLMGPLRSADGQIIGVIVTVRDITQRKQAQDSHALLQTLIDYSNDGITVVDPESARFLHANDKFCSRLGYTREEVISMNLSEINPTMDAASFLRLNETLKNDGAFLLETFHRHKNGTTIPMEVNIKSVRLDREYLVGVARDVTERKRSEELLRQSHERFQVLAASTFEGICINEGGRIVDCNEQFAQIYGYERSELIDTSVERLIAPEIRQQVVAIITEGRDTNMRHRSIRKDGSSIVVEARGRVVPYSGRPVRITAVRDVTDRVKMEEMAIQSEKMLSIGGLAAGMAHEINNPLAIMMQNAQVISHRISSDSPQNRAAAERAGTSIEAIGAYMINREIPDLLSGIHKSGERAASIVRNMLAFSRPNSTTMGMHRLDELITQAVELARSDYELKTRYDLERVDVVSEFDSGLPPVACHGGEVQQVILNLFKNALQAFAVNSHSSMTPRIVLRTRCEKDHARIEVEDNGTGMSESVRRRVFEPFFTTKSPGEGTGLGLFISYFIISHHHKGTMCVNPSPTGGTRFEVMLPLNGQEPPSHTIEE